MSAWNRHRFKTSFDDDPRPVTFPPPGPWWCTGHGEGCAVVVCYLPPGVPVTDFWPEAADVETEATDEIVFTDRFPRPDWWEEGR